ncbi:MAG: hypothetical protein E7613_00240 [Ruminococcaceae bacterium]|nr:hypothetical protein [Oscillospiraceae bacterium]
MDRNVNYKKIGIITVIILLVAAASICAFVFLSDTGFKKSVRSEAGQPITLSLFFEDNPPAEAFFENDTSHIDVNTPGVYTVNILVGDDKYTSELTITDTTGPKVSVKKDVKSWLGKTPAPETCIESIEDITETSVQWYTAPKDAPGLQDGVLLVTDAFGNKTRVDITITVVEDKSAPIIEGVSDRHMYLYDDANLLEGVVAKDTIDPNPVLSVSSDGSFYAPGEYKIVYTAVDGAGNTATKECILVLEEDKEAPEIECAPVYNVPVGKGIDVKSLPEITDNAASEPKLTLSEEPDTSIEGSYNVTFTVSDRSGNISEAQCTVNVANDTTAPIIGVKQIIVFAGDTVSYKKQITVTDDFCGDIKLSIDSSKVNLNTVGEYTASFTATDISGNISNAEVPVSVVERPSFEAETHRLADELLSELVTDDMTDLEKLYAIFVWINKNIYYTGTSDKSNYIVGAYDALTKRMGDCYNYYALARILIEHMGFEQMEVQRDHPNTKHYWNLVYYNGGWYHFDASPFVRGNLRTFMMTDSEAETWDRTYYSIGHLFDKSLYPERATESVQQYVDFVNRRIINQ